MKEETGYINVYDETIPEVFGIDAIYPTEEMAKENIVDKEHYIETKIVTLY